MATYNQFSPVEGSDFIVLDQQLVNDDPGAIYNSLTLNSTDQLDNQLYALPENQTNYATVSDLVADWNVSIRSQPTGEVYNGWSSANNGDGSFDFTHIDGFVDFDYTQFDTDADSDMMALTIAIPKSQLEFDGVPGYNPATDAQIVLAAQRNDAYVAEEGGTFGREFNAPGQQYEVHVIPEPSGAALVTAGLIAMAGRRAASSLTDRVKNAFKKR